MSFGVWSLFYSKEDLTSRVQSFTHETTFNLIVRLLLLCVNLGNVWYIIHLYEVHRLFMFFTNWTLLVTVAYLAIAIPAPFTKSMSLLALHHILFEICFMMNLIVVTVFWSVLYEEAINDCKGDQAKILNVYYAHIVPGASALINFMLTDVVVRAAHVKMVIVISLMYGYVNYSETMKMGKPLYWFLTWQDSTSYYIYAGLMVLFTGVFFALASVTLMLKPRPQN